MKTYKSSKNYETLLKNTKATIKKMKKRGTVSASPKCLQQNVPTTGLTCTVAEYEMIWAEILAEKAVFAFTQWSI